MFWWLSKRRRLEARVRKLTAEVERLRRRLMLANERWTEVLLDVQRTNERHVRALEARNSAPLMRPLGVFRPPPS
jgi:hypothetical protein